MVGLRTQEDDRFVRFFKIIQEKANKLNSVFFLDCGEGHSVFEDDIICTDCSGWLVPSDKVQDFQKEYDKFQDNESWEKYVAWVTWKKDQSGIVINLSKL